MSPVFITSIIGLAIAVLTLGQVAPSIQMAIYAKATQNNLSREEALAQQIILFQDKEGTAPSSVQDLITKNYWRASDNDNGYGSGYSFSLDTAKGILTIDTTIANSAARAVYLGSALHTYKPSEKSAGVVSTTFIIPSRGSVGSQLSVPGRIPASSTAPDPASNTYWYDTSGSSAVMRVSNGSSWLAAAVSGSSGTGSSSLSLDTSKIVSDPTALPTTANDGDVRYIFNAVSNTLDTLTYYNGGWRQTITGSPYAPGANPLIVALSAQQIPRAQVGVPFSFDFKPSISAVYSSNLAPVTVDTSKIYWAAPAGLPAGLTLNSSTGVVSGTPTTKSIRPPDPGTGFNIVATYGGSSGQGSFNVSIAPINWQASQLSASGGHACAVTTSGGLKCWGNNLYGQIGDGTSGTGTNKYYPTDVAGMTSGVSSVAASGDSTCAVTSSGGVKCWGNNSYGQLGNGTLTKSASPVDVIGLTSGVASVSGQNAFYCAVTTGGAAYCWGFGAYGELGNNTATYSSTPVQVSGLSSGVKSISAGLSTACVTMVDGTARCWGEGRWGQLGNGALNSSSVPVVVSGLTNAASVKTNQYHTCAILTDASLKCWGDNAYGQMANGTATGTFSTPISIPGQTNIKGFTVLNMGTCSVSNAGVMQCWGDNQYSQTGNGNATGPVTSPTTVTGLSSGVSFVATSGGYSQCAQSSTLGVVCWGLNTSGQVGDGTSLNRSTPVSIYENW